MTKIYFVNCGNTAEINAVDIVRPENVLCSYYYWKNKSLSAWIEPFNDHYYPPEEIEEVDPDILQHSLLLLSRKTKEFLNSEAGRGYRKDLDLDVTEIWEDFDYFYERFFPNFEPYCPNIMLDSGAYSAWKGNKGVDIDDYIDYVKRNKEVIEHFINLDVIGDCQKSYENFLYMKNKGLNPLPVFHWKSDMKWLDMYVDLGCKYICLGGTTQERNKRKVAKWYSGLKKKHPSIKFHLLGSSSPKILSTNIYSCDSTTYINKAMTQVYCKEDNSDLSPRGRGFKKNDYVVKYMHDTETYVSI